MIIGTTLFRILRRIPSKLHFPFTEQKPSGILKKSKVLNDDVEENKFRTQRIEIRRPEHAKPKQSQLRTIQRKVEILEEQQPVEPVPVEPKKKQRRKSQFLEQMPVTSYKYEDRQAKIEQFIKKHQSTTIDFNSFPFSAKSNTSQQKLQNLAGSHYITDKVKEQLTKLSEKLTQSILTEEISQDLSKHIEPTFELHLRKAVRQIKANGWSIEFHRAVDPKIEILDVKMIKGMKTTRNNNFTSGQYIIERQSESEGVTWFIPHITQNGNIEQMGYSLVYNMVLQVVCRIDTSITLTKGAKKENITSVVFTFENQMRWPPMYSELKLKNQIYNKNYRVQKDEWVLSDVNQKNPYIKFEYTEDEKKQLYSRVL